MLYLLRMCEEPESLLIAARKQFLPVQLYIALDSLLMVQIVEERCR